MSFKKYITLNGTGEALWTATLIAAGYFFSHWYLVVGNTIGQASIVAMVVVVVSALIWIARIARNRLIDDTGDTDA